MRPLEAGVGVKLAPSHPFPLPGLSQLSRCGAWGSVPTAWVRRAQGEGLLASLASTALREETGEGSVGSNIWMDE